MTFAGRPLVVEVRQVAKQATGAVVVVGWRYNGIINSCYVQKDGNGRFLPLQVNYEEKMYEAGKFPGF